MRLNGRRLVGLLAIVVFGGILISNFLPSAHDTPRGPAAVLLEHPVTPSPVTSPTPAPVPDTTPIADPLSVGSQEAQDDLYCSGLIFAKHLETGDILSDDSRKRREQIVALAKSGYTRLVAERAVPATKISDIADAHTAQAQRDYAAGTPRIALEKCLERAAIPEG
ncbi:MAG: hypothetical protein ABL973_04635 [Micropepsaceae bacterium]